MNTSKLMLAAWSAAMALLSTSAVGQGIDDQTDKAEALEEIIVLGREISMQSASVKVEEEMLMDTAAALKDLPGGDVNVNGRISGIAQYRGMYGDRVSVTIDGIGMIGGGPNAMDTPLSYVSPMITEDLVLERGIPGVASAPESVGGHIDAKLARGSFSDDADFGIAGTLGTRYSGNGNSSTSVGRFTVANGNHKISLIAEADRADDIDTPEGSIYPSGLTRDRADISYAFTGNSTDFLLFAGMLDTEDAGTPALAMDIRVIDTQIYGTRFRKDLSQDLMIDASIGYNDVFHEMDNFSLRPAPGNPMGYRMNTATGSGTNFELATIAEIGDNIWRFGLDGKLATHDSVISNPDNPMFLVQNFSDIQRDLIGIFAVWQRETESSDWEVGLRFNEIRTDAGMVATRGLMGMMGDAADVLSTAFNDAERDQQFRNFDVVAKYQRPVLANAELHLEIGSKTRAPSYQELYLWLPLQATGGLADGRNYIGNLDLDSERSNEINIGLGWSTGNFDISPQVFFKSVDNYIQGVPSDNMAANMLSVMMSGATALEFENVEAEIYGFDLAWKYRVTDSVYFDGLVAYARGKRTDIDDNLYRLAPLNASIGVNYVASNWAAKTEILGYAHQDKVSSFNDEQPSAGYGILNMSAVWSPWQAVKLEARADNLFDRSYQNHLAGVNRVAGSDIPTGTRLYGAGRTLSAGLVFTF